MKEQSLHSDKNNIEHIFTYKLLVNEIIAHNHLFILYIHKE